MSVINFISKTAYIAVAETDNRIKSEIVAQIDKIMSVDCKSDRIHAFVAEKIVERALETYGICDIILELESDSEVPYRNYSQEQNIMQKSVSSYHSVLVFISQNYKLYLINFHLFLRIALILQKKYTI